MSSNTNRWDTTSSEVGATERILQSVLAALSEGKSSEAADQFDEHFYLQRPGARTRVFR